VLQQACQLLFVRLIILFARILVIDTNLFGQIREDNLRVVILCRIITLILTLMDTPLATVSLRAELRRTVLLLSNDASAGAMLLLIRIDLFIAILLQPLILFRRNYRGTRLQRSACIYDYWAVLQKLSSHNTCHNIVASV